MPTKKFRSRKIANGSPNAVWNRMSPEHGVEEMRPVVEREDRDQRHLQRHDEHATTTTNSQSRPGKSSQAKA